MTKTSVRHSTCLQETYIIWLSFMVLIPPGVFPNFSKFWFSRLSGWQWKGKKMVQNDKKFCLSHLMSQEWCNIIWSSLMVLYKMRIFPSIFFIFFKILFFEIIRDVKSNNWPKMTKNSVCLSLHLGTVNHMIVIFGTHE